MFLTNIFYLSIFFFSLSAWARNLATTFADGGLDKEAKMQFFQVRSQAQEAQRHSCGTCRRCDRGEVS